ncbi:MAG: SDR family NAD(P)-dependent oxidoreductase [Phycisphaerales bacterium JB059]
MIDLRDKPIAITGASSGIGAASAFLCAKAGMPVALMARRAERLGQIADRIRGEGGRAIVVPGSVEDPEAGRRLIEETVGAFGSIYSVFANAGYGLEVPTSEMSEEDVRRIFEVNFHGSLNVARPALAHMRRAGQGHVLFCSSCLSKISISYYGAYSATKACQDHFARSMRLELRDKGIAVSSVHPIGTRTEFFDAAAALGGDLKIADQKNTMFLQSPERVARAVVKRLRKGRGGEVWTSLPVRTALGLSVVFPGITDRTLAMLLRKRERMTARQRASKTTQ